MSVERAAPRRQSERRREDRGQRDDGAPGGIDRRERARRVGSRGADADRRGQ